ncbi:glycosyltransferase family 87 protein [Plastoroseomonas hellenica]|uniref:glycosyltransferase family 87 protein n=1 Tax=Plastoroseomonas hellenica TaxID=2687306 RepID=UPI001BABC80C|nr:glycosyltransferase family 87 protein [Plastoroseomonas hellenica]MBR0646763.1 DUF2029 domain-containing protein [Plastoroseomonas hellenica]
MTTLLYLLVDIGAVAAGIAAVLAIARAGWSPRAEALGVLALSGAAALFIFATSEPQARFGDFRDAYYLGGVAALRGPEAFGALFDQGVHGWVNLPIVAYLFAPFALLPARESAFVFSLLGLIPVALAWHLLSRLAGLEGRDRWLLLFLFAVSGPLHYSVKEANTSHMVLAGLAGGLLLLRAGRHVAAGLLLGAMAVIKLPLLLFGVAFVLRRNWRAAFGFALLCGSAGLLSLAVFGLDLHLLWYERCVRQFASNPLGAFNVQSIPALLIRVVEGPSVLRDWDAREIASTQRLAGSVLTGLLYLAALIACARRAPEPPRESSAAAHERTDIEYLLVICLAVIGSPLSWSHYYAWLLMPIAFLLGPHFLLRGTAAGQRMVWVAIFLITPTVLLLEIPNPTLMAAYNAIGVSHLMFGGLLLFALLVRARARLGMAVPPLSRVEGRAGAPARS